MILKIKAALYLIIIAIICLFIFTAGAVLFIAIHAFWAFSRALDIDWRFAEELPRGREWIVEE